MEWQRWSKIGSRLWISLACSAPLETPVNFYRSLGAVDFVSPGTTVTINPLRLPQIPLRAICSHWHDFSNTGPNWRMVWVHDARRLAGNPLMQYPTYMVMKRGVDALLDRRPHGLVELLSFIPDRVNVVFPSVTPVKVNRPVVLQLLGNLGPYCTRFVHCQVWLNGVKLDTLMVDAQHGFYILVQLRVAPGVDAVMAKEATDSIVGHGRFLHLVSAPGVLIVHCPGGRTLLHSRSMQLTQHLGLPDPDVLVKARDEWPDLLGMALRTVHVHHSVFMFVVSPAEVRTVELVIPADLAFGLIAICLSLHFDTWSNDGGVFTQRFLTLDFLLQQLGLSTWCAQTDLTCECFHNGEPLTNAPRGTYEGDFVGCWLLTRSPIEEDAVCACSESAEEESDEAFESNHTVPASPRAPARKRAFPGPSSAASPTTGLSSGDRSPVVGADGDWGAPWARTPLGSQPLQTNDVGHLTEA